MRLLSCAVLLAAAATTPADDFKPEAGYALLFNGKDLTGWKTKAKAGEALDGKAEAFGGRFKAAGGELVIDPKVKGDVRIETAKEFGKDCTIKFEFKPDAKCNNDLFLHGTKFDIKKGVKGLKDDDWNEVEIVAAGGQVAYKINGEAAGTLKATREASTFEIRAEFGAIQIRKLRAKEG